MPIETYTNNPALRPTVFARDVLKNVYRPSGPIAVPQPGSGATEPVVPETSRAA